MNNQTERFLTFAYDKVVNDEGFCYTFRDTEVELLPTSDSELMLTLTFEGQIEAIYRQYEGLTELVDETKIFDEDVKLTEILNWLKSKIK